MQSVTMPALGLHADSWVAIGITGITAVCELPFGNGHEIVTFARACEELSGFVLIETIVAVTVVEVPFTGA